MLKCIFLIFFVACFWETIAQSKAVPLTLIKEQHEKRLIIKKDSLITFYSTPLIEVNNFFVNFDSAFYISNLGIMRLYGKICFRSGTPCIGLQGVNIFVAKINTRNVLYNIKEVGESSYDKDSVDKNGYFDIRFNLKPGYSLFFEMPNFYLDQYKIWAIKRKLR
jgi:hypothetical protein